MGEKSPAANAGGRPCRANSAVPTLSGPYSKSVANTSDGPMRVTAPLPKSPTSSGMGNVANCATGKVAPTVDGRTKIRLSKPWGNRDVMPCAPMVATLSPAEFARRPPRLRRPAAVAGEDVGERPWVQARIARMDPRGAEHVVGRRLARRSVLPGPAARAGVPGPGPVVLGPVVLG